MATQAICENETGVSANVRSNVHLKIWKSSGIWPHYLRFSQQCWWGLWV